MALAKWQAVLLLAFALLGICHAKPNLSKAVSLIDQIGGFNHRTLKTVERAKLLPGKLLPYRSASLEVSRHLLQDNRQRCVWNEADQKCSLSDQAISNFTSKLDDDDADKVTQLLACEGKGDEDSCVSSECVWDKDDGCKTEFFDSSFEQCLSSEDKLLALENISDTCGETYPSRDACNEIDECTWNYNNDKCDIDFWFILAGIPSEDGDPIGFESLLVVREEELQALVGENADPEAYLDLDPPPFNCPTVGEPIVCELVDLSDNLLKTVSYCANKYVIDLIGCTEDPLCEVDENNRCNAARNISEGFAAEVKEVLFLSVEDPLSRPIWRSIFECSVRTESDCDQKCEWDAEDGSCELENGHFYRDFGKIVAKAGTVDCLISGTMMQSGCFLIESREDCVAKEDCVWNAESGCTIQPDVIFNLLFRLNPVAGDSLALNEDCSRQTSEDACMSLLP